jgi:ankyrin repeat protein
MKAAEGGFFETVKLLNESFTDLKAFEEKGMTVLHHAAVKGNLEVIEYLMLRGAEINQKTRNGKTPMALAVESRKTEAAGLIERYGGIE